MSFKLERSESPQRNGLAQLFSKTRRDKKDKDSAGNSVKSTNSESRGVRSSLEDAMDKLKGHEVTEEDIDPSGIKKLAKGLGTSKRRRKKREEEQQANEEIARGRTVADRGTLADNEDISPSADNGSGGDRSSLTTYDSETES